MIFLSKKVKNSIEYNVNIHFNKLSTTINSYIDHNVNNNIFYDSGDFDNTFFKRNNDLFSKILLYSLELYSLKSDYKGFRKIFCLKTIKKTLAKVQDKLNFTVSRILFIEHHFPTLKKNNNFKKHYKQILKQNKEYRLFIKNM